MSSDDPGFMPFAVVDVVCQTAMEMAKLVAGTVARGDVGHAFLAAGMLLMLRDHGETGTAARMRELADALERGERPAGMVN